MKRNHLEKAKVDVVEAPRQLGVEQASEHAMVCNARAKKDSGTGSPQDASAGEGVTRTQHLGLN